jgi:filamentous hemagglutinin family protein
MTNSSLPQSGTRGSDAGARGSRGRPRRAWLSATAGYIVLAGLAAGLPSTALAITPIGPPPGLPVQTGTPQVNTGGTAPDIVIPNSNELDVTLHAPRTVIDWSAYDLFAGNTVKYAFDARNWIVLNRIQSPTTPVIAGVIEGRVNGAFGGNIWFSSSNGLIFGNGARVDAGGLLISAASPDLAGFLDPANLTFNFSGQEIDGVSAINLQAGSTINGHGGLVALISPTIIGEAGSSVTGAGGSNVLYGATRGYQLRLQQGAPGDFDLVDFIVSDPSLGSDAPVALDLQNSTAANSVFVAAVSSSTAGSAVINLQGMVTAQAAVSDGGDIVLSGGGGLVGRAPGAALGVHDDIYLNQATASRDIVLQTNGQVFGQPAQLGDSAPGPSQVSILTAGRDIKLLAGGAVSLGTAKSGGALTTDSQTLQAKSLTAAGAATLKTEAGDLNAAFLSLGGPSQATSAGAVRFNSLRVGGPLKVQAATDVVLGNGADPADGGAGVISVNAGRDVKAILGSATFDAVTAAGTASLQAKTLTAGAVKAQQILAQGGSVSLTSATSAGDVYVSSTAGPATVGAATAGDDIYILATGGAASLKSATITGGPDTLGPTFSGNPDTAGNGHVVTVQSADSDALLGLAQGAVTGATVVNVKAGQDATVDVTGAVPGALTVTAARDVTLRAPSVTFSAVQAGRDLTLTATTGDFTNTKTLVAAHNVTIGAAGALTLGDITAGAGTIALTGGTITAGALTAAQDLTLKATAGAVTLKSFKSGRDFIAQGATLSLGQEVTPVGRDLSITTTGDFVSASDLTAGRNLTFSVGGLANLQGVSGPGTIDILAKDLTLAGAVSAATVQIESASGPLTVGGSGGGAGLNLDNGEFGRIHATGQVNLFAGPAGGGARGDLTLLDLDVNPQSTPQVNFLAGGGHNALVQGLVAPTASGGILRIGDGGNAAWQPNSILVTGAIGAATFSGGAYSNIRSFDDVRLFATQDIIIGSQRFIGLIQAAAPADIEIGRNKPGGVAPTAAEQNRVLVVAGTLELSAAGKVVSQNTAPTPIQSVGLFLTGKTGQPDLLIDPPQVVDLYGSFVSQAGVVVSSFSAGSGLPFAVIDSSGNPTAAPAGAVFRFNSCAVGTSQCSAAATVTSNLAQNTPTLATVGGLGGDSAGGSDSGGGEDSGGGSGGGGGGKGGARGGPALLSVGPVEADEVLVDPVATGAGSEEIWRKRKHDGEPERSAKP